MKIFTNRYVLVLTILFALFAGVSIYAYASKSFNGNTSKNQNINKNVASPGQANTNQPSEVQNEPSNDVDTQTEPLQPSKDIKVKGVYLTGWTAGRENALNHFIDLANKTELNSVVIDVKDDEGRVSYKSEVPMVKEIGSSYSMIKDIKSVLKKLKDNNIYAIARIVVFKDPILAEKRPDLAIKTTSGKIWRGRGHAPWLNPYNKDSWGYSIELAKEAEKLGFDEVQFDYIRFPADGQVSTIDYGEAGKKADKTVPINEFLATAKKELKIPVSADVFGIITTNIGDVEKIGQDLETISKDIDYISPMVYPSHYGSGQYGFKKPDLEPYKIVHKSLSTAKARLDKLPDNKATIRPYLQDFTATWLGSGNYKKYTAADVRTQIKAAYDSGLDQWILWSASNKYSEAAFLPEQ